MKRVVVNDETGKVANIIEVEDVHAVHYPGHSLRDYDEYMGVGKPYEKTSGVDMARDKKADEDRDYNLSIIAQLLEIDQKKVRAITDAVLNGDLSRLQALEAAAIALRAQLREIK